MAGARTKGTAVVGTVRFLRKHKERARALLPEHLHHYLEERILAVGWYPEEDQLALVRACVKLNDMPEREAFRLMGSWLASEHYRSVYGRMGRNPDAKNVITRMSSLWSAQHDTGRHVFIVETPTRGRIEVAGFAYPSRETCAMVGEYSRKFLSLAGWGEGTVQKVKCVLNGDDRCCWRFTWTKPLEGSVVPRA
jgi:hypothetical protein